MNVRGIEDKNMPLPEFLHYLQLIQSKPGPHDQETHEKVKEAEMNNWNQLFF